MRVNLLGIPAKTGLGFLQLRVSGMVRLAWPWLYQFLRDPKMALLGFWPDPCIMEQPLPAVCRSLGYLNYDKTFFRLF